LRAALRPGHGAEHYLHLRCSHSHCSGCSRHPAFDHRRDRLHRGFDGDPARGVARGGSLTPYAVGVAGATDECPLSGATRKTYTCCEFFRPWHDSDFVRGVKNVRLSENSGRTWGDGFHPASKRAGSTGNAERCQRQPSVHVGRRCPQALRNSSLRADLRSSRCGRRTPGRARTASTARASERPARRDCPMM
jgi:hypothetical protein